MSTYTTAEQIDDAYSTLQRTFKSGKTKSIAWRKWQLKQMWWSVSDNEERIAKALHADLNRHDFETYFVDIGGLKQEILQTIKNLESWSSDERIDAGFLFGTLCGAHLRKEPLGVALVLGTWNFPFVVTLSPAIAAISAGCAVMVKPSEITPASQDLMAELISKYLDPDAIRVVTGGPKETALILERRYDSIFFTGSPKIAKVVSTAAAKHLTPTTLELGGQAPCIVTPSANVDLAAKRIMLSKFLNSGQICLAANHVFVDPEVYSEFLEKAKYWANQHLAGEGKSQQTRIVNHRNYDRLVDMLNQSEGRIAFGGSQDRESKYIQPTVVEVNVKDPLMSEEIFGPLLPVMKMDYRQACETTSRMEHPLGLYIFSNQQEEIDQILSKTNSGGVTINDTMIHAGVPNAPFGGVGNSGSGARHGRYGFDAFTHRRTVLNMPAWMDYLIGFRYPPYDTKNISKVNVTKPGFKRGETMEDQNVGGSGKTKAYVAAFTKWSLIAVAFALVDAKMGGRPKLLEVLGSGMDGVRSRLPV